MKFDHFSHILGPKYCIFHKKFQKRIILFVEILLRMICQKLMSNDSYNFVILGPALHRWKEDVAEEPETSPWPLVASSQVTSCAQVTV